MLRLDKFLSDAAPYSRKEVRALVKRRAVTVNGKPVSAPDVKIDENSAQVQVDGKTVIYRKFIYLMLNKPQGYLSATEDDRDPVVTDLVPEELKHFAPFPVGRLDKDTEGLLLLTNDGQFDHELMSPRKNLFKRYYAELDQLVQRREQSTSRRTSLASLAALPYRDSWRASLVRFLWDRFILSVLLSVPSTRTLHATWQSSG